MKNYFMHNNTKYEISEETAKELARIFGNKSDRVLADFSAGETFKLGNMEFIVLEQLDSSTVAIMKSLFAEDEKFGNNNNYNGSNVDSVCAAIAKNIFDIIGEDNVIAHEVDLTANNGMKCYGTIMRKVSLPTAEQIRKYAYILSENTVDKWWWLATPSGTTKWGTDDYALCVSPLGSINVNIFSCHYYGVRPFCIFNSSISVS